MADRDSQDSCERFDELCHKAAIRNILFTWRLNAVKSVACSMVVRAVEDGSRKAQDLFRSLTTSPWISRNVVWDGYNQDPFTGTTHSRLYWISSRISENEKISFEVLSEALEVQL